MTQPYPIPDQGRLMRVIQDVADLLQFDELDPNVDADKKLIRKVTRWIGHVLLKVQNRRWWFLENLAVGTLAAGDDLIDLKGHIDRVSAIYAPKRLHNISLAAITELRMRAAACKQANGGEPTHYAIEAGRRVHLWPCPVAESTPLAVLYQRPIHVAILPPEWEAFLLDGVLGMYGRHFDKNQLAHDPQEFERRWLSALKRAAIDHHDISVTDTWQRANCATTQWVANSSTDTATVRIVPSSLGGIGFELILPEGEAMLVEEDDQLLVNPASPLGTLDVNDEELMFNDGNPPADDDYIQEVQ